MSDLEQQFCKDIFRMKYMIKGEKTPDEVFRGISQEIASVEKPRNRKYWEETFFNAISSRRFIPGGRILANARPNSKLKNYGNCYVIPIKDSLSSIYNALKEDAIISGSGGGVGFNISALRPKDALISKGGESSGPMSFAEVFDSSAKTIRNGGGRRCLPAWYQVVMGDKSLKTISEIQVGDEVLFEDANASKIDVLSGKKEDMWVTHKVTNVFNQGVQRVYYLKTSMGEHVSTLNHRWLVRENTSGELSWKTVEEIKKAKANTYSFLSPDLSEQEDLLDSHAGEFYIDPIGEVTEGEEVATFDIEVEDVHAFFASNPHSDNYVSVSHNSAHILIMDVSHPDIEEFITYKQGDTNKKLTSFNISVGISQEFIDAVNHDSTWQLTFEGKVYKEMKARDLFDKIISNAFVHNEPGLLMYPAIEKRNAGWYIPEIGKITASNPCAEQPLPPYGVCNLAAVNLTQFVVNPFETNAYFDWHEFKRTVEIGVRFSDNVIDAMTYPLPQIEKLQKATRRVGLGFTGLADTMSMLGYCYGDDDSVLFAGSVSSNLRKFSLEASISLAKEKGCFKYLDKKKYLEAELQSQMSPDMKKKFMRYGIRNIALNTVAPVGTGSIALGMNCSSGIEPVFAIEYDRKVRIGDEDETFTETVYDYAYLLAKKLGFADIKIKTISEIDPYDAMKVQQAVQSNLDSAVSKTYNLPEAYTFEDYRNLVYKALESGLVGFTSYNPNGSLAPVLSVKKEESSSKEDRPSKFEQHSAPKRPKDLECDIHVISVKGKKYTLLIGKYEDRPYEVFATEYAEGVLALKKNTKGIVRKIKKGHYSLVVDEEVTIDNISNTFNADYEPLNRMLSVSLRHGTPIEFVVEQLSRSTSFGTWGKMVSVVLKKYIKDGVARSKEKCPTCGEDLIFVEGCKSCPSCGFSKCS